MESVHPQVKDCLGQFKLRNNDWLAARLEELWQRHFADIARPNTIHIHFGRRAATRLGSIRRRTNGETTITLTGYFRDPRVPQAIIDETIAHELVHYTHGFESPLPKLYRYPHEGGVVRRELKDRGLGETYRTSRRWLRTEWRAWMKTIHPRRHRRR